MIAEVLERTSWPVPSLAGATGWRSRNAAPTSRPPIDTSVRNVQVWGSTPVWGSPERNSKTPPGPTAGQGGPGWPAITARAVGSAPLPRAWDAARPTVTPARYPPNDPGWACPGVTVARAPEYRRSDPS
jgi:hypothetical protein